MDSFRALTAALLKRRISAPLSALEQRISSLLSASDWFVVAILGAVMALAAGTLLAGVSVAMTVEVPEHGGVYTEGVIGTPRFVNPLLAISDTDRDLSALVYSGLLKEDPDGSLSPDLASSYTVSNDKLTYTFMLKDDARFQDGTPVTAEDIAYTVQEAQNPDVKSSVRANWQGVTVAIVDPKTVSFTLKSPYAPFLENATLGILPKHLWQGVTAEEFPFSTLNTHPVGSGPYRVAGVAQNSSGIPTEYDLAAFSGGARAPYISAFVFRFYADADLLTRALNQGEVAAAYGVDPKGVSAAYSLKEAVYNRIFAVFLDQNQNKIFADAAVRQALDESVDKGALVSTVLHGYGSVIDGPLPPDATVGGTGVPADLAGARAILEKDGWKMGDDGVYAKTTGTGKKKATQRLAFSLSTSNAPDLKSAAQAVAGDWKALGADVSLQFFEASDLATDVIQPRKYDALLFGEVVGRGSDLYPFWHSSQMNDPGLNIALYANASVDKLLEAARIEQDPALRRAKAEAAAKTISAETAAIFLYSPHFVYLAPQDARGIMLDTIDTPSDRFAGADRWYLSTERVWPVFELDGTELIGKIFPFLTQKRLIN